ncbi:MAG TPA: hypothetical protein PLS10_05255 [Chitinophagales bacterium]|nr:hypothetical protein [Chitinophagales bacterium]
MGIYIVSGNFKIHQLNINEKILKSIELIEEVKSKNFIRVYFALALQTDANKVKSIK